jgi:RNA polymerase sigma-70 factor, ECF subfamily
VQNNHNIDTLSEQEVESLVELARKGKTEAFGRIYDVFADRIYRHIYYRTGNIEDAQDLTQEVFAKAWQVLPKYKKTTTPFLGWLFTISHNRVIDYYRTKKDHAYLDNEIDVPDSGISPEEYAESSFSQHQLRKAILQLPENQQQVIIMTFIEGYGYPEVAAALNKSEGNIRVMVHRALKQMQQILDKEKE